MPTKKKTPGAKPAQKEEAAKKKPASKPPEPAPLEKAEAKPAAGGAGKQAHRAGKPSNPFLVNKPPPRLGRPIR